MPAARARTAPWVSSTVTSANPSTTQSAEPVLRSSTGMSTLLPVAALVRPISPCIWYEAHGGVPGGIGNGGAGDAFGASGMGPVVAGSGSHGTKEGDAAFGAGTELHAVMSTKTAAAANRISTHLTAPLGMRYAGLKAPVVQRRPNPWPGRLRQVSRQRLRPAEPRQVVRILRVLYRAIVPLLA